MKVASEAGGVPVACCNSFLSELEEYDEEQGVILGVNTQTAKALLLPITGIMDSNLILQFIDGKILK